MAGNVPPHHRQRKMSKMQLNDESDNAGVTVGAVADTELKVSDARGAQRRRGESTQKPSTTKTATMTRLLSPIAAALKFKYVVLLPVWLALFTTTPIYTYLRATALPPPGPLPPHNTTPEFILQRLFAPILLLFLALLIPARTRTQRWIVSGVFAPAILYLNWGSLSCGSRSSGLGLAIGASYTHLYNIPLWL